MAGQVPGGPWFAGGVRTSWAYSRPGRLPESSLSACPVLGLLTVRARRVEPTPVQKAPRPTSGHGQESSEVA